MSNIVQFLDFIGDPQPISECGFSAFVIGQPVKVDEGLRIDLAMQISKDYHTYAGLKTEDVIPLVVNMIKERKGKPLEHSDYLAIDFGSDIVAKTTFLGEANRIICSRQSLENVIKFHQDNGTVDQFSQYYRAFIVPDNVLGEDEYLVLLNTEYAKVLAYEVFENTDTELHLVFGPIAMDLCQWVKRRGLYMGEMPK